MCFIVLAQNYIRDFKEIVSGIRKPAEQRQQAADDTMPDPEWVRRSARKASSSCFCPKSSHAWVGPCCGEDHPHFWLQGVLEVPVTKPGGGSSEGTGQKSQFLPGSRTKDNVSSIHLFETSLNISASTGAIPRSHKASTPIETNLKSFTAA